MRRCAVAILSMLLAGTISAQSVPSAIFTDPPIDVEYPAHMTVLRIPTHGVQVNGIIYKASGAGMHPTLVICHGLPGNEKDIDLAQAVHGPGGMQ